MGIASWRWRGRPSRSPRRPPKESDAHDRTAHVGYYLIDKGRRVLERAMGTRVPLLMRATRAARPLRLFLYLAPIVLLTALAVAFLLVYVVRGRSGRRAPRSSSPSSASSAASALVVPIVHLADHAHRAPADAAPTGLLRRHTGRSPDHGGRPHLDRLAKRTSPTSWRPWRYAISGNRDPNLFFALLTDFRDAPERTQPGDDDLIDLARAGIEALNDTYSEDRPGIFYLFHRPRVWNPHERVWMG